MRMLIASAALSLLASPALADDVADFDFGISTGTEARDELPPYLQCVPYARKVSGIELYGDAYTWWDQAQGQYATGTKPKVGAVMAFKPYRSMQLGHVAAVSKVIDPRHVLLDHANWSPINGRRGQIEKGVMAVDVSPANDWSQVRVWYAPLGDLGTTAWPVEGFIYADRDAKPRKQATPATTLASAGVTERKEPSKRFLIAFAKFQ